MASSGDDAASASPSGATASADDVVASLERRGTELGRAGDNEAALAAFDEMLREVRAQGDSAPAADVASALFNVGTARRLLGHTDEAVAAFDEVVARFGDASDLALRRFVAMALYNKGVALSGRVSLKGAIVEGVAAVLPDGLAAEFGAAQLQVVAAADEMLARFGADTDALIVERVVRASLNKATALALLGRHPEAADAFSDVATMIEGWEDPLAEQLSATAALGMGRNLDLSGRFDEARATLDALVVRWRGSADPAVHDVVAAAQRDLALRVGLAPPARRSRESASEIDRLREYRLTFARDLWRPAIPFVASLGAAVLVHRSLPRAPARRALWLVPAAGFLSWAVRARRARGAWSYLQALRHEWAEHDASRFASHAVAVEVLARHRSTGEPFVLYLRSFDVEETDDIGTELGRPVRVSQVRATPGIEDQLVAALAGRVACIAVEKPGSSVMGEVLRSSSIPRLALPDESWRETVADLIVAAAFVVVDYAGGSGGISAELGMILQLGRADRTVVVIDPPEAADGLLEAMRTMHDLPSQPDSPSPDDVAILSTRFARVDLADRIPWQDLDASPLFADLLTGFDAAE